MSHTPTQINAAYALMDAGNLTGARTSFEHILADTPDHVPALCGMAASLIGEDNKKALACTLDALARDPENDYATRILALIHMQLKKKQEAIGAANRAVELESFNPDNHHIQGIVLARYDQREGAEAAYKRGLELDPYSTALLSDYARLLNDMGRTSEANDLSEQAVHLAPGSANALAARGETALLAGELDEAMSLAVEALRVDANNPSAIQLLVEIKTRKNPIMGIWWHWMRWMNSLGSSSMRWGVIIGLYIAWQVFRRTVLVNTPEPVQMLGIAAWVGFCVLTWVGPSLFNNMLKKEMKTVNLKAGF
jgi:tetratricopeptide (TPR) repeat protein